MQKRILLLLILLLPCCVYRGYAQDMDPVDMNDKFVMMQDTLRTMSRDWNKKFKELDKGTRQFGELSPLRAAWQEFVERKLVEVKSMKDTGGSIKFRGAVYTLLLYEKQILTNAIAPFEKLSNHAGLAQMKPYNDKLLEIAKKEKDYRTNIINEQTIFAKKNRFNLGEKTEEE